MQFLIKSDENYDVILNLVYISIFNSLYPTISFYQENSIIKNKNIKQQYYGPIYKALQKNIVPMNFTVTDKKGNKIEKEIDISKYIDSWKYFQKFTFEMMS